MMFKELAKIANEAIEEVKRDIDGQMDGLQIALVWLLLYFTALLGLLWGSLTSLTPKRTPIHKSIKGNLSKDFDRSLGKRI